MEKIRVSIRGLRQYGDYGWAWSQREPYEDDYSPLRTNKQGEGLFTNIPTSLACTDTQILGTGQFSVPTTDHKRAYRYIRYCAERDLRAAGY